MLSAAQLAQLRDGMDVTTNSVDPSLPDLGPGASPVLPLMNTYTAFVNGWSKDGSSIQVTNWTVMGGHDPRGGQVPGSRLDRHWTNYPTPTAFFAAPTKDFSNVWVLGYDPTRDRHGIPATSLMHRLEGLELDMFNDAPTDYEASFHGMTINYSPHAYKKDGAGQQKAVRPAADSYDLLLGGDGIQKILRLAGTSDSIEIDGTTIHVNGNTGIPARIPGRPARAETAETVTEADGNRLRMVMWGQRESSDPGWRGASANLGLIVDGSVGDPAAGSAMGRVAFNPAGHLGGVAVLSANGAGLTVDGDGGVSLRAVRRSQLPQSSAAGTSFYCSDCLAPGEAAGKGSGMIVFRNGRGAWKTMSGVEAVN